LGTDTIQVIYDSMPVVNLGNDTSICAGQSLQLNATNAGANYIWQDGSANPTYLVTAGGTYWVIVSSGVCPPAIDSITVTFNVLPTVSLGNDTTLCMGQSLILNATFPGATYLWQDHSTGAVLNVNAGGNYSVTVTDANGCSASDTIDVNYNQLPLANLGADTTICPGHKIILDVTFPGASYLWQDGSTNPGFAIDIPGAYWVTTSLTGCSSSDTLNVASGDCECEIFMPNAFTPNHDGLNDIFKPQYYCSFSSYEMDVFNRWGKLIFRSTDIKQGWDGTENGTPALIDVYVWRVTYSAEDALGNVTEKMVRGNVTLLR